MSNAFHWLFRAIGWLLTLVFGLSAILAAVEGHVVAATSFFVIAVLSLPPIWANEKRRRYAPIWGRVVVGIVATAIAGATLPHVAEKVPVGEVAAKKLEPESAATKPDTNSVNQAAPVTAAPPITAGASTLSLDADEANIIGRWLDPLPGGFGIVVIKRLGHGYILLAEPTDGNPYSFQIKRHSGSRFDSPDSQTGDYFVVLSDGRLDMRDEQGRVRLLEVAPGGAHNSAARTAALLTAREKLLKSTETPSNWEYRDFQDDMRGTTEHVASVVSDNTLVLSWPYRGGHARLNLYQKPGRALRIALQADGQFLCSRSLSGSVAVKFDDGPVEKYPCGNASSGDTKVVFIRNEVRFLAKLRTANTVVIEATFFQDGRRQMLFSVAGLKWD